ncbi:hypothetical protein CLG94_09615 [Candidatus Methylomirabilis limnetica]|uniref:Uncharacterized protein n=1 Tax=Candidatus Methylomirabilis limnetica TaxID=2033718 RepID=A0A2T4TWM7_9BACT|nr:hypothetical protein CLG94_09615 [Candidatus Methylomirabilis limnetica]
MARAIDDPLNGFTQFGYDLNGNLLSVTDTWGSGRLGVRQTEPCEATGADGPTGRERWSRI